MENSDKIVQESNAEAVLKSELKGDEAINDPINPDIAYLKSLRSKTPTNNGDITGDKEDGILAKLKTVVNNPFQAIKTFINPSDGIESLTGLRKTNDAADAGNSDAVNQLDRSSALNSASAMAGPLMAAQTGLDLVSGDFMGAVTKKASKLTGGVVSPKLAKNTYNAYKTNKHVINKLFR